MSILKIKKWLCVLVVLCFSGWAVADTYVYDQLNRLTSVAYSNGGSQTYVYDAAGNLTSLVSTPPTPTNFTLTVNKAGAGTGTVAGSGINCGATCAASVLSGSTVTLTATPGSGSSFGSWTGYAGCASANPCTFTMPAAAVTVSANFATTGTTYPLAATASPVAGGTVTGMGNFAAASARTVTATANPGYTFSAWSGYAGCATATANPCTFNMPAAAVTLVATFTAIPNTYPVTLAASPVAGGTVTGAGSYASGTARTVTATPNAGYTFSAWSGYAGCASANPCNFTMPASAVTMTATFTATTTPGTGLVAHYCFDDPSNLGKDCSTNANHGTPSGGVSAVAGKLGGAALFGGFNNPGVIHVPNSPTLQFVSASTLSFFVKIDSPAGMDGYGNLVPNGQFSAVAKRHDQAGVYWNFGINAANQLVLGFGGSGGKVTTTPGTDVLAGWATGATGRWVHVAHVVDNVGLKTYMDGQLAWSVNGAVDFSIANTQDMYIGRYSSIWYPLNGTLDELKLFNRALSATEIQALYANTGPKGDITPILFLLLSD